MDEIGAVEYPSSRQTGDMYRSILENCPVPIYVARLSDGTVVYQTPAVAELVRDRLGDAVDLDTAFEMDPDELRDYTRLVRDNGSVDRFSMHFTLIDGRRFVGAVSGRLVDIAGEPVIVTSLIDLTDQIRREAELQQAREQLEDAVEALEDGFILYDADDRLVTCNSRYKQFHGDSADLLVPGAHWPEVTRRRAERGYFIAAEGQLEAWMAGQMAQRGIAKNEEFPFRGGRWFEYSHRPTRQGGFVSVWHEITERKKMEQALRQSEEHFRSIVEGHPLPVWMVDLETFEILYESPAAAELFGRNVTDNSTVFATDHFIKPQDRRSLIDELRKTGALRDVEVQLRKVDGSTFWASRSDRLISYGGRDVSISSFIDLTARRQAEAEAARQRDLLHQSEKLSSLGELLASVAHELNNPLSVLIGQALMLKERAPDGHIAERAEKIGNAADRCARIVKTFLAMARQESGEAGPVDINELVERALEFTSYSLKTGGIEVSLDFAPDLPVVTGSADQLIQVFTNLIVNAEQALGDNTGPRKLRIATFLTENGRQVAVRFTDNGPGVPEYARLRIFEPLYTTKGPGSGTGLGLALCHRIVEAHGGSIELETSTGSGASFVVRLFSDLAAAPEPAHAPGDSVLGSEILRILVVDDEPDVGLLIGDTLEFDGHAVLVTQSARDALELIKQRDFDVIISDLRMPEMDGIAFYKALQEAKPAQIEGLAFITGDTLSSRVGDFLARSDRPFLEKPFMPDDTRELVRRVMKRKAG